MERGSSGRLIAARPDLGPSSDPHLSPIGWCGSLASGCGTSSFLLWFSGAGVRREWVSNQPSAFTETTDEGRRNRHFEDLFFAGGQTGLRVLAPGASSRRAEPAGSFRDPAPPAYVTGDLHRPCRRSPFLRISLFHCSALLAALTPQALQRRPAAPREAARASVASRRMAALRVRGCPRRAPVGRPALGGAPWRGPLARAE